MKRRRWVSKTKTGSQLKPNLIKGVQYNILLPLKKLQELR
jgi:hypothetical protein